MSLSEWAKREVEIACKRERGNAPEDEWDYGCACYESALKAFNSLMEDGHSGMSIVFTKNILMRLIDGKPLTPIEDTDDVWDERDYLRKKGVVHSYQCNRMSSLFKDVYADGTVKYSDVARYYCSSLDNPNSTYTFSLVTRWLDENYPITMPYMPPTKPLKIVCEDFLTDRKNGDFDTVGILYMIDPCGDRTDICKYYKSDASTNDLDWVEIDEETYNERKARKL